MFWIINRINWKKLEDLSLETVRMFLNDSNNFFYITV